MRKGEKIRDPNEWTEIHIKKDTRNEVDLYRAKNKLKTFEEAIKKLLKNG